MRPRGSQVVNRSPASTGAAELTAYSAASSTSCAKPRSISSLPDPHPERASQSLCRKRAKEDTANSASGERAPPSSARTAPAPMRSSKHGRSVLSSQRSPAGITAMREPHAAARFATAGAFRRHAVNVGTRFALRARVLPFGEGNTKRVCAGMERSEDGESEYAGHRSTRSQQGVLPAGKSGAESSFHW